MKKITKTCPYCSNLITDTPDKDNLGYYMYCLDCDASFDVDVVDLNKLHNYTLTLTTDKFFNRYYENVDTFTCKMFVDMNINISIKNKEAKWYCIPSLDCFVPITYRQILFDISKVEYEREIVGTEFYDNITIYESEVF